MGIVPLSDICKRAGVSDPSTLHKDIKAGRLIAHRFGKVWAVEEAEAERWIREEWPKHVAARKKPVGSRSKK